MNGWDLATYATSAAFLAHWFTSGMTLANPSRPSWVAFSANAIASVVFTAIMALANAPVGVVWGPQTYAQIAMAGLLAAAGSAGASVTQTSAESKRQAAAANTSEPDPVTPTPRVGGQP
jgi:hypothetical protein